MKKRFDKGSVRLEFGTHVSEQMVKAVGLFELLLQSSVFFTQLLVLVAASEAVKFEEV